ncbi:MAG: hypothetical protein GEU86_22800 [Actinophytocola sp.]|nr:hypothetical protein [Actinophytocola sp.]
MGVHKVSEGCEGGDCPAVYVSDRGTVVFQGDAVPVAEGLRLGEGEQAVELPLDVLKSALPALLGRL